MNSDRSPAGAHDHNRIGAVDVLRGLAICGMVAFHLAWDLHAFGWTDLDPSRSLGWTVFGHGIAACFLSLSGLGLVLARDRGATIPQALRRIGVIAAAALGVTLVTALVTAGEKVWFGILHCIALGNLLALPALGAPVLAILAAAAAALAIPIVVAGHAPAAWWWLGLSDQLPATIDVRPLLPWFGVVLLGVWAGRIGAGAWLRRLGTPGRSAAPLATAGRHSLAIYLAHQPLLFGLFWSLAALHLAPPRPAAADAAAFADQCRAACVKTTPADRCDLFCACARWHLQRAAPSAQFTPELIAGAAEACGAGAGPLELH